VIRLEITKSESTSDYLYYPTVVEELSELTKSHEGRRSRLLRSRKLAVADFTKSSEWIKVTRDESELERQLRLHDV